MPTKRPHETMKFLYDSMSNAKKNHFVTIYVNLIGCFDFQKQQKKSTSKVSSPEI